MTIDQQVLAKIRYLYFVENIKNMKEIERIVDISYTRIKLEIKRAKTGK